MARRQESRYTLYLLILVVAIILLVGLLSVGGPKADASGKSSPQPAPTKTEIKTDTAVATVSFIILPPETEGGGE